MLYHMVLVINLKDESFYCKLLSIGEGLIFRAFRPFLEDIGQKRNIFASFTWFLDVKHIEVVKANKDQHI